jgi:hypothetical protein
MRYSELIKQLAQKYFLTISTQEQNEKLSLHINDTSFILQTSADKNAFFIYLDLYKVLSEPSASFYKKILSANLLSQETNGFFIGYDSLAGTLYLMEKIEDENLTLSNLENKIHCMLFTASRLKEKIMIWEVESMQESTHTSPTPYPMQKYKV